MLLGRAAQVPPTGHADDNHAYKNNDQLDDRSDRLPHVVRSPDEVSGGNPEDGLSLQDQKEQAADNSSKDS